MLVTSRTISTSLCLRLGAGNGNRRHVPSGRIARHQPERSPATWQTRTVRDSVNARRALRPNRAGTAGGATAVWQWRVDSIQVPGSLSFAYGLASSQMDRSDSELHGIP